MEPWGEHMTSSEHLQEAERWLKEAETLYVRSPMAETSWMKIQAAVDIARAHAIIAVQLDGDEDR